ncbi:hypothetical protein NE237_006390 [Protea cynaroides]|uniref:Uncharacterized protein n=1 Tax=Protea cynaroides TaxID=273540 RepID=A0A9Q0KN08_9MAGN|nr:hypothetical protein NE237_006390 [Protea cynaroides]
MQWLTPPMRVWMKHTAALVCMLQLDLVLQNNVLRWVGAGWEWRKLLMLMIFLLGGLFILLVQSMQSISYCCRECSDHCYCSCLELLIEKEPQRLSAVSLLICTCGNKFESLTLSTATCLEGERWIYREVLKRGMYVCVYFPQQRTVRRFLEKQKDNITAIVFCTTTSSDTDIYKRLLPLYFPRDKHEEEVAVLKLPADVGDENDYLVDKNSSYLESYLDPAFMSIIKDPDQRRKEQWEKAAQAQSSFNCAKLLGFGDIGGPPLSAAEEFSLHSRYLAKANSLNLSEITKMKIVCRGGVDSEGRPIMVVVGALLRCRDLERFVLYVIKASRSPRSGGLSHGNWNCFNKIDWGWFTVNGMDRDQSPILWMGSDGAIRQGPGFCRHDLEVNGGKGLIVDPRTKYVYPGP